MNSTIVKDCIFSSVLNKEWQYCVYIPNVENVSILPIMYLFHGASHQFDVWFEKGKLHQHLDKAILNNSILPLIVVTVSSEMNGYSWYVDQDKCKFETAFFQDFIPQFEQLYGETRNRSQRIVAGSSMGGYGALRYSLIYPEIFSRSLLVAPAIWDDILDIDINKGLSHDVVLAPFCIEGVLKKQRWDYYFYTNYIDQYLEKNISVQFYTSAGDRDYFGLYFFAAKLHQFLNHHHQQTTLRICDGDHGDWDYYPLAVIDGLRDFHSKNL